MSKPTLSSYLPNDNWKSRKLESLKIADIYISDEELRTRGERIAKCAGRLIFGQTLSSPGSPKGLKLIHARFCRIRYCPICMWRRSMVWRARFYKSMPALIAQYPTHRYIFLTLTVRNCELGKLRDTIVAMNAGFKRLQRHTVFSAVQGYIRSTEITREDNGRAHPHFHCILMVPGSYFGKRYQKKDVWIDAWKECLKVDYRPSIDIRACSGGRKGRPRKYGIENDEVDKRFDRGGVLDTLKYAVKPKDLTTDPDWLILMTKQTIGLRAIATGGLLRNVLRGTDKRISNDELIYPDGKGNDIIDMMLSFLWHDKDYIFEELLSSEVMKKKYRLDDESRVYDKKIRYFERMDRERRRESLLRF